MRIGVNTLFLIPGEVGGSETYLLQTLLAMAQHHADVEIVLFTNQENDPFLRAHLHDFPPVSFHPLTFQARNRTHRILREQVHLPWAVSRSGIDVLWSPGYTAPLFCPCPQAVSILDMQYKTHPEDMTFPTRLATDILVQMGVKSSQAILTISNFSRSEILQHTRANDANIEVTPLGVDPAFNPTVPLPIIRAGIAHIVPPEIPYLLCVANTYPHKNIAHLVAAYARMQTRIAHHLVLVGNPRRGERAVTQALCSAPEPHRIHRLRGVDRSTLIALYQGAEIFIFPSLYEGFGLPVLEAMMAGTPVLTTRMASIPEVGGDCVWYLDPSPTTALDAAIQELLDLSPDQRQTRVDAARNRARAYTWRDTSTATVQCLRRIAASAPKK